MHIFLIIFLFCNLPIKSTNIDSSILQIQDLANSFCDSEVLIRFAVVPDLSGELMYMAYVFKHGMDAPHLYSICSEKNLLALVDDKYDYYNETQLLSRILSPISHELCNVETIYFIPAGKLHEIALEYCKDSNGKMFCENYNVFRFSSPSVLNELGRKKSKQKVAIWGGIDFNADIPELTICEYSDILSASKSNIGYLEDSYRAAVLINDEIRQQGICSDFYFDNEATEKNFKSQQWKTIDIFFIETHGLFLNNYNMASAQNKEDPMENYALALAGASYVLEGGIVPDSIDDGILTAKEISELDLSNVDLAVISACKSALGEIRQDGVYGLTRGFKLAGVKSLIMATDDIVDYVSGQLWIQLFRNLSKGMTKREALFQGLKYIRTMDDGAFSHPKYWTPFILIDGLE